MVRRPGDKRPEFSGGPAAERLRMFEAARGRADTTPGETPDRQKRKSRKGTKEDAPVKPGGRANAKQDRRKV